MFFNLKRKFNPINFFDNRCKKNLISIIYIKINLKRFFYKQKILLPRDVIKSTERFYIWREMFWINVILKYIKLWNISDLIFNCIDFVPIGKRLAVCDWLVFMEFASRQINIINKLNILKNSLHIKRIYLFIYLFFKFYLNDVKLFHFIFNRFIWCGILTNLNFFNIFFSLLLNFFFFKKKFNTLIKSIRISKYKFSIVNSFSFTNLLNEIRVIDNAKKSVNKNIWNMNYRVMFSVLKHRVYKLKNMNKEWFIRDQIYLTFDQKLKFLKNIILYKNIKLKKNFFKNFDVFKRFVVFLFDYFLLDSQIFSINWKYWLQKIYGLNFFDNMMSLKNSKYMRWFLFKPFFFVNKLYKPWKQKKRFKFCVTPFSKHKKLFPVFNFNFTYWKNVSYWNGLLTFFFKRKWKNKYYRAKLDFFNTYVFYSF